MNTLNALKALDAAIILARAGLGAVERVSALLATAQAEGRDVTDAELASVRDNLDAAKDAWDRRTRA